MTSTSEAHLQTLAGYAFLRMWSYPNLYNDKGANSRAAIGQELCDLLLLFGDCVGIFSDKHCLLRSGGSLGLSWSRWYRRAISKSAEQVRGAERWLSAFPDRIFRDRQCRQPLPIHLTRNPEVFRILTIRGARDAARSEWGGRGSLLVTNRALHECVDAPFRLGAFDEDDRLFHVFDENALDAILSTLDTPSDFLAYLRERERFFRQRLEITAYSEEDLLGFYMMSLDQAGNEHRFPIEPSQPYIFIDGDQWDTWLHSPQRAARDAANSVSYLWDRIVDHFAHHALQGTQEFAIPPDVASQEILLRWLLREDRFRRRILSEKILGMVAATPPGKILRSLVDPWRAGDPFLVLLAFPRPPDMLFDVYRDRRRRQLIDHVYVVKHLHPEATDVVGLALGAEPTRESEDAIYLDARTWTADMALQARRAHEEGGIFRHATKTTARHWEYPTGAKDDV